ncbi:hypothetical protein KCU89_g16818, partial [Aureobasidium melanogenum]
FNSVNTVIQNAASYSGKLFGTAAGNESKCQAALGRSCQVDSYSQSSGTLNTYTDTSFFGDFAGLHIASASSAAQAAANVPGNAGAGRIHP